MHITVFYDKVKQCFPTEMLTSFHESSNLRLNVPFPISFWATTLGKCISWQTSSVLQNVALFGE